MGRRAAVAALAWLMAGSGCRRPESVPVFDLVRAAPAAEAEFPWEYLAFGTLAAQPFQEKGFERAATEPFEDSHAVARLKPQVLLRWSDPAARLAVLDAAPYRGLRGVSAEVSLNNTALGRLTLGEGRRRYVLPLPAAAQRPGGNRLYLDFDPPGAAPRDGPRPMARLYSLAVGRADDADLAWLGRDGAPPALGIGRGPRASAVAQAGPSAVRFAFRAPARAELRFVPDLDARARAAGAAAVFSVAVGGGDGRERELWHRRVGAEDPPPEEVALDLDAAAGQPLTLVLRVQPERGRRPAWALWQALRVMGDPHGIVSEAASAPSPGDVAARGGAGLDGANVLLVILDAAGAGHFGCYGYPRRTTPEIDRIAAEGVVYDRAYTPSVFTRSSMASIWTSQYPDQHRVGVDEDVGIAEDRPTVAELVAGRGIHAVGFIGNPVARGFGLDRGFAEFHSVYTQKVNLGLVTHAEAFRAILPGFFQTHRSGRFFAYVHYLEPHFPYDPPPPFNTIFGPDAPLSADQRRQNDWFSAVNDGRTTATPAEIDHLRRLYDGSLAYVDREVGFLRRTLEEAGLWERTLVILAADHGEGLREHGWIGHMKQVYEEAAHVPLIVHYPAGKRPAASRIKEVVCLLDLAPTIADALDVPVVPGTFVGRSLLRGAPETRVVTRNTDLEPTYGVTEDRYRLVFQTTDRAQQLYDAVADPGEVQRQALQRFLLGLRPEKPTPIRPLSPAEVEALRALGYVR
ncbi:MAG: hypothetical protein DMF80_13675 [Acidobacteria bacterium]|nr:MAG: hypothetical protein DMF80_13675 [Acidobacteriota bacterium]